MLRLDVGHLDELAGAAYLAYPLEFCALLAGPLADVLAPADAARSQTVAAVYPCRNAADSSKRYAVDPGEFLRIERDAQANGWELVGVAHSHTHSEPFPSPTDVAEAPDPTWHYVIVGLRRESPEVRSYLIVDGAVVEEPVVIDTAAIDTAAIDAATIPS